MIEKYIKTEQEPEVDLDLKYLKIIDDLFNNNILTRQDLLSNLGCFIANYSKDKIKHLSWIYWNEEKINSFFDMHFESECNFARRIINLIETTNTDNLTILWDLDGTIISKSLQNNWTHDYVRPSFIFLAKYLSYNMPQVNNWILSSRSYSNILRVKESLNSIISTSKFFQASLVHSVESSNSVEFADKSMRDIIPTKQICQSLIQKLNKHYFISQQYPTKIIILVDDIIPIEYEQLWYWIAINQALSFKFPRFWMNLKSLHRHHEIYFISQLVNVLNE